MHRLKDMVHIVPSFQKEFGCASRRMAVLMRPIEHLPEGINKLCIAGQPSLDSQGSFKETRVHLRCWVRGLFRSLIHSGSCWLLLLEGEGLVRL